MKLIITLRQDVEDQPEAEDVANHVKQFLENRPEIKISAHCTNHFWLEPSPPE